MNKLTGYRCKVRKLGNTFKGYVVVFDAGRRMYQLTARIVRLSAGDAMTDARNLANELAVIKFEEQS